MLDAVVITKEEACSGCGKTEPSGSIVLWVDGDIWHSTCFLGVSISAEGCEGFKASEASWQQLT